MAPHHKGEQGAGEHSSGHREKVVRRSLAAAAGLGAAALVGVAVDRGVDAYQHNHPPAPQGQRVISTASSGSVPESSPDGAPTPTPSSSDALPTPSKSAEGPPFGTPLGYTLHMKDGKVKRVKLLPMSCPPDCERKPVPGQPDVVSVKLIPPENYEGWRNVYYYTDDPRLILAHSTEIPANASYFAGQYFSNIEKGDKLELKTSTGVHEYVAESIATPDKGTLDFNRSVQTLGKDDLLFVTCAVPNDEYNVVIEFVPDAQPAAAASIRLGAAATASLTPAA